MRTNAGRLFFVVQSEGLKEALGRIKNIVLSRLGLRVSETYFYRLHISEISDFWNPVAVTSLSRFRFRALANSTDLKCYRPLPTKMEFIPIEMWFSRCSVCIALELDDSIVAYTWIHFKYYDNLGLAGILILDENEVFIGPFYTDPAQRGKKLYYLMMAESLRYLKDEGIKTVYTASNSENIPTIKVAIRSGFDLVGSVRARKSQNRTILDFNREELLSTKLRPHS